MSRKSATVRRDILPDPKFNDKLVAKLINKVMMQGKKSIAEGVVYRTFDFLREKTNDDPIKVFKEALDNVKPAMEVRSRRVGGATYQVPMEVRPDRRISLGLRWLILNARGRSEKSMEEKLSAEILDARTNRGGAVKKREDVHRMAKANQAFAHYRW